MCTCGADGKRMGHASVGTFNPCLLWVAVGHRCSYCLATSAAASTCPHATVASSSYLMANATAGCTVISEGLLCLAKRSTTSTRASLLYYYRWVPCLSQQQRRQCDCNQLSHPKHDRNMKPLRLETRQLFAKPDSYNNRSAKPRNRIHEHHIHIALQRWLVAHSIPNCQVEQTSPTRTVWAVCMYIPLLYDFPCVFKLQ
jgi:hypothetical protein